MYATVDAMKKFIPRQEQMPNEDEDLRTRLREVEAMSRTLLNARVTDSTLVIDKAANIRAVNVIAADRLGKPVAELIGENLYDLFPGKLGIFRKARIDEVFESGKPNRFEDERLGVVFDNHVYPVIDERGEVSSVVIFARDITGQKKAEADADLRQEQLVQADKLSSLGVLVSGVAHEINNPNQFIMSNISLLDKVWHGASPILEEYFDQNGDFSMGGIRYSTLRERVPKLISDIASGSERIKHIVQELRDFARHEEADLTDDVDINAVVKSAAALVAGMVDDSIGDLHIHCADDLPLVRGNFQRLEQVVVNLIINAWQALRKPSDRISVSTRRSPDAHSVSIEVRDTGVGIPEEGLKRLTDPFYTTKRESGGTGLGLSISNSIVLEHAGVLSFDSTLGEGTVVTITLPQGEGANTGTKAPQ